MHDEESFGVIPLQKDAGGWRVLVVQREQGFWEFPKGHPDPGEQPLETAKRELFEESGLTLSRLLSPTPLEIGYQFMLEGCLIRKKVYYFLAEVEGSVLLRPGETKGSRWVALEKAHFQLTFATSKELCKQVIQTLQSIT